MKHTVSVIILNWNGKDHLEKCLRSFKKVSYHPLEVMVVDNASLDGSIAMVEKEFPHVKIVKNKTNLGYSGGNNKGILESKGDYVFILNNDTEVTKDFLEPLVRGMKTDSKIGCIQPKLLYGADHNMLNAVGSYLTSTGFLYHYGYRKDSKRSQYNKSIPIFSAKGAAMLFRRSALEKVGLFDEDFFIFFEETDLCHRLWLAGYTVMYEPASVVYHYEAVDTNAQMKNFRRTFLSFRNRICSYLKNLESKEIIKIFLILMPIYIFLFFFYAFMLQFDQSRAIVMSFLWNIVQLPKTIKKRRFIQEKLRRQSDNMLFPVIKKDPPLAYYYYLFTSLKNYKNEKPI